MNPRSAIAAALIAATLTPVQALQAQSLHTGLVLAGSDVGEVSFRTAPEHDVRPPPKLERMSVGEALQGHLVGWMGGEALGVVSGARVHIVHLNRGRIVQRFDPGPAFPLDKATTGRGEEYAYEEEELQMIPARRFLPDGLSRDEVAERRVRGYDLSSRPVSVGRVLERPGSFVVNGGVFPSPREDRLGNTLLLVLAPADRELSSRSEGTVMLVMF